VVSDNGANMVKAVKLLHDKELEKWTNEDEAKDEAKDDEDDEDGEKKIQKVMVKWKVVTMKFCARALQWQCAVSSLGRLGKYSLIS